MDNKMPETKEELVANYMRYMGGCWSKNFKGMTGDHLRALAALFDEMPEYAPKVGMLYRGQTRQREETDYCWATMLCWTEFREDGVCDSVDVSLRDDGLNTMRVIDQHGDIGTAHPEYNIANLKQWLGWLYQEGTDDK